MLPKATSLVKRMRRMRATSNNLPVPTSPVAAVVDRTAAAAADRPGLVPAPRRPQVPDPNATQRGRPPRGQPVARSRHSIPLASDRVAGMGSRYNHKPLRCKRGSFAAPAVEAAEAVCCSGFPGGVGVAACPRGSWRWYFGGSGCPGAV